MLLVYLVIFGLFFAEGFMSGELFSWLATLPIARDDLKKIGMFTFFRGLDVPLIVLLLTIPIGTGIRYPTMNWFLFYSAMVFAPSTRQLFKPSSRERAGWKTTIR